MTLPSTETLLHKLGWDDGWEASFADHRAAGLVPARVAIQHRGAYDLIAEAGELRASATTPSLQERRAAGRRRLGRLRPGVEPRRGRARPAHAHLAQGGVAGGARAGARGQHRRRVPRPGAAARLQRAPARALPRNGVGVRRAADRPADEDRPRRRRHAVPRRGRSGHARLVPGTRACPRRPAPGSTSCVRGSSRTAPPSCSGRRASASRRS